MPANAKRIAKALSMKTTHAMALLFITLIIAVIAIEWVTGEWLIFDILENLK
jgi:hypothetical protein